MPPSTAASTAAKPDLLVAAFELIAETGWRGFSRRALAARAGVPLDVVAAELPDRTALVTALGRRLDRAMLAGDPAEFDGMTVRERLFELVMKRLDAMAPFRAGLRALARDATTAPELVAPTCGNLGRAADWMLDAANAGLSGWRATVAANLLAALHVQVVRVWLGDDSDDQAATLAELDKRLAQLERLARWSGAGTAPGDAASAEASAA